MIGRKGALYGYTNVYKRSLQQAMQVRSPAGSCDPGENAAMTFQIAEQTLMVCPKSKNKPWY